MRIGFDVSQTGKGKAGCGYFADSLIRRLATVDSTNEYLLYPTFGDFYWDENWTRSIAPIPSSRFRLMPGHHEYEDLQRYWRSFRSVGDEYTGDVDIVHANNFYCPTSVGGAKMVYTLYDMSFIEDPSWTTEPNRIGCFQGIFNASLHADLIVSISEFSRRHFLETFPHYPEERCKVIPLASRYEGREPVACPARLTKFDTQQFWLCVGTIEPRKNYLRILEGYSRLKSKVGKTWPLLIAGGNGWLMHDFETQIDALGLRDDVVLLGYVSEKELQWLYQNCATLVYVSLWEGFGLPALEAMSQGAPVITSNSTSLIEVAGTAGLLVDPNDPQQICSAMEEVARDESLRKELSRQSLRRASEFSWTSAAQELIRCYEEVTGTSALPELARAG